MPAVPTKRDTREALRSAQRAYLQRALDHDPAHRTLTEIARAGGLNPSTLTRFVNNVQFEGVLDALTLQRVSDVTGVPLTGALSSGNANGLAEEAEPYLVVPGTPEEALIKPLLAGRHQADPWRLHTTALAGAGYMPGDLVIVETGLEPRAGDAVCANIYERSRLAAETVWRIYEPPYLIAASTDTALRKPLLVDNERVLIRGVIVATLRLRPEL